MDFLRIEVFQDTKRVLIALVES